MLLDSFEPATEPVEFLAVVGKCLLEALCEATGIDARRSESIRVDTFSCDFLTEVVRHTVEPVESLLVTSVATRVPVGK